MVIFERSFSTVGDVWLAMRLDCWGGSECHKYLEVSPSTYGSLHVAASVLVCNESYGTHSTLAAALFPLTASTRYDSLYSSITGLLCSGFGLGLDLGKSLDGRSSPSGSFKVSHSGFIG
ncbi:hypothetical protein B0H17DRAFT_1126332 [Mycena rosella]|uniref:Uncharacterized protein n=1 Tax=Mycena rosella TaxID=1033263 RepID=A0AAD7GUK7_MYCRO|nr:hypothetical protein B0H17DRAFT_1126332 [Mycena rosella]